MTSNYDNRPIGVFDSGLGGLTIARAIQEALPGESVIYLGDTARVPYGDKSVDAIISYAHDDVHFMLSKGVKLIVAACNTVSAVALEALHTNYPKEPIIGVIDSGVKAALAAGARSITVIGTRATINSDAYRRELHRHDHSLKVDSIACPLLVPLAEEGIVSGSILEGVFDFYLKQYRINPPDALLLGCTHYPLFKTALDEYFNGKVQLIDSAKACAQAVLEYLNVNGKTAQPDNTPCHRYFVSDLAAEFNQHATRFLGQLPTRVERIVL